jgi:hypothetical protein
VPLAWEWKGNSIRQTTVDNAATSDKSTSLIAPPALPWSPAAPPGSSGSGHSRGGSACSHKGGAAGSHAVAGAAVGPPPRRFTFDHLFVPGDATAKLYSNAVRDVVLAAAWGYHASVCAYGQTSTGKTYTMQGTNRHPGLLPLAVKKKKRARERN